ncbi:RNA polymerase recycling motor HelD [Metabacillus halosaccharovorans]|uniref:RNA polymerase recycling motor HelD n=1 Tax=Metabacillus halosaccharovorans TaxID=930124 RepID=UPI00203DCB00|nr:RNA polymerase recycling motor HelD [Metabacillus halosaccharovorans]MCM3440609.1 UvrD-helicase domain-containing protein [Metabacillus halosaccharovorans]
MDSFEETKKLEQERIDFIIHKMKADLIALTEKTSTVKTDIVSMRKNFWEDVTVNLDDAVEASETAASIKQQAEFLSEREHRHKHLHRDLKNLQRLVDTPYFARIDFLEKGEQVIESIYLGIASYIDRKTDEFLIYDWRAPISSLYYDYSLGQAEFKAPGGTVKGELTLKRQFIIKNAVIEGMFDTGITIGDELLQEVLGNQSNTQMKSIVATIQQEQNQVIRNEKGKLLIVQGAAGSGKTSAALQRVAYLLYQYRETLEAEEILLFSPNLMFNSYIRNVLPELGEENMQQTTFQQYLEHFLAKDFEVEDPFTQTEYMLTANSDNNYSVRRHSAKFKSSFQYMTLINHYLEHLSEEGLVFHDIIFREELLISSEQIKSHFYSISKTISTPNRIKLVTDWLLGELKAIEKRERKKAWVDEEIQYLSKEEYQFYYEKLSKQKRFTQDTFDDYDREQEMLRKYVVKRHLSPVRKQIKSQAFLNMKKMYEQIFELDPKTLLGGETLNLSMDIWEGVRSFTLKELKRDRLLYEDATPFLYLKEKIIGFQVNTSVKYVFIDEAQDYSAFQYAFINHLFPNARLTILGDMNQAIYAHNSQSGIAALKELFPDVRAETIILTKSYRSTKPIIEFTRELLESAKSIIPFNRDGKKPIVIEKDNQEDLLRGIIEKVKYFQQYKTVAIICQSAQEAEVVHKKLQSQLEVQLVDKRSNEYNEGNVIIPAYLAKGIEFDVVIIYDGSDEVYGSEQVKKLFYTACTRAMHELVIFSKGNISSLVENVPNHLYTKES